MEKKATPKQVEWRKRHISRRNKGNTNQTRKQTPPSITKPKEPHFAGISEMHAAVHPS